MRWLSVISGAMVAMMWLGGCSSGERKAEAVPRPVAYPRVTQLNDSYYVPDSLALSFEVNSATRTAVKSPYWFDIVYADYGATVFVTVTKTAPDSMAAVIANRRERVMRNVGDITAVSMFECNSPEFTSYIYRSPSVRSTPLQFISSDGLGTVVSGAVFFGDVTPDAPVDSLAPMVERIQLDLVYGLNNLTNR